MDGVELADALAAVDRTTVGVFAYLDERGRPTGLPVTPYVDGGHALVTTTLAFIRKAEHVRRDGRVALLAGGVHLRGHARVEVDLSGDAFVARVLEQERRKYPPAEQILSVPFHRRLFAWYFGRVFMPIAADYADTRAGSDACTLLTLDADGFPSVAPLTPLPPDVDTFALSPEIRVSDGPAAILFHRENLPEMTDIRQALLRGEVQDGRFTVRSRRGSLAHSTVATSVRGQVCQQIELWRRARRARRTIAQW